MTRRPKPLGATLDEAARSVARGAQRTPHETTDTVRESCGCFSGWYVVETQTNRQHMAEYLLAAVGWEVFHPLHLHRTLRHPDKTVSLFPGYLFVWFSERAKWQGIASTPGVVQVLGSGGAPRPVPTPLVDNLRARTSARRIVDDPLAAEAPPYAAGTRLTILEGPFAGWGGICQLASSERVELLLAMLGREVSVALRPAQVAPDC